MTDDGRSTLTAGGAARRERMREALLGEFVRMHHRRRRRVRAVASVLLLMAATGIALVATPSPRATNVAKATPAVPAAQPRVTIVQRSVELDRYVRAKSGYRMYAGLQLKQWYTEQGPSDHAEPLNAQSNRVAVL